MNRIAEESKVAKGGSGLDGHEEIAGDGVPLEKSTKKTGGKDTKVRKSRKKKKKDRTEMTADELRIDDRKRKLREIYDCLMFSQCYIQYSKYGSYIPLEQVGTQFDLRILQLFVFYFLFSLISGALSSDSQSKGVSFARAVAIIFLMNELELVFNYQQTMDSMSGKEQQDDPSSFGGQGGALQQKSRIDFINTIFSSTWCVYEKIHTLRLVYFLVFNVSSIIAEIYFDDKFARELGQMKQVFANQKKLVDVSKKIFKKYHKDLQEYKRKPLGTKTPPMNKIRTA